MRRITVITLVITVLAACIGASLSRGTVPWPQQDPGKQEQPIDQKVRLPLTALRAPAGLGGKALERVRTLCDFGPRNPGNPAAPGWSKQLEYIANELQKAGLTVKRDTWTDRKELITFTNLSVTIPGTRKERIVLACHHDTKCTSGHADPANNFPFVGANDGGSAVALLIELAPVLRAQKRNATIDLVFFDGEESLDWKWGDGSRALFGSKRFVSRHRDALLRPAEPGTDKEARIEALILLDMVGRTDLHIQEETYSTPHLRKILWSAAVACGHEQFVFRRDESASDDHKPFLDVGIPAVDLIDLNGNPHWHKPTDTIENMSAHSLQITADLVLTMLPEVERSYVLGKD